MGGFSLPAFRRSHQNMCVPGITQLHRRWRSRAYEQEFLDFRNGQKSPNYVLSDEKHSWSVSVK